MKKRAILVGGYPLTQTEKDEICELKDDGGYFVAVDGGLNAFYELAILPDILLGDMDSCENDAYKWYCRQYGRQLFFPSNKDYLDMEAALNLTDNLGFQEVFLFGVLGGRIDQTFSCIPFLIKGADLGLTITIKTEECQMGIFKGPSKNVVHSELNAGWSFIAISDVVEGLTLKGFKYNLDNRELLNTQTTTLSNRAISSEVMINIKNGLLIYFNKPGRQENVEHKESF